MTAAPHATRMTARRITDERSFLMAEAADMSEALARFARDVDHGIACGEHHQLGGRMQRWLTCAAVYNAINETVGLYNTELSGAPDA